MVTCCGNDDSQGHLGFSKQKSGAQQAQPEGNMFAHGKFIGYDGDMCWDS